MRSAPDRRRQRRRPHRCGGDGIGRARRSYRPRHRPAARPHLGRRPRRQDAGRGAAGRAGSGLCGMVDAGASRARSPVRAAGRARRSILPLARKIASGVGIAEIVLLERKQGAWMHAGGRANCRSTRSPAPKPGSRCPAARKGLRRARRSMPICCGNDMSSGMTNTPSPKDRDSVDQDQFLTILSREDALARFEAALVSARGAGRAAAACGRARLRAGRGRGGADRRAAVRPLQCRRLCGAFRRSRLGRRSARRSA